LRMYFGKINLDLEKENWNAENNIGMNLGHR
jgi:hypothetical protein